MFPYITILNKEITMYSLMSLIGIFTSGIFAIKLAKKKTGDSYDMLVLLLISSVGVLLGSHILYGLTNIEFIIRVFHHLDLITSFDAFLNVFSYAFGGAVFYGGMLGGIVFGYIYIKNKKLDRKIYFDLGTLVIPLFSIFGRIGCFLSGCCYGVESDIGFRYEHAIIESANHVNRFPIQLVESGFNAFLFFLLYYFYKKSKFKGKLIYIYLTFYAIARFIFEFFRGDHYRGFLFGLSTSQIVSLLIVLFLLIKYITKKIKK